MCNEPKQAPFTLTDPRILDRGDNVVVILNIPKTWKCQGCGETQIDFDTRFLDRLLLIIQGFFCAKCQTPVHLDQMEGDLLNPFQ